MVFLKCVYHDYAIWCIYYASSLCETVNVLNFVD